jgi:phage FluMu protein Com
VRAHYWRCVACNWVGVEAEMPHAPHPFLPGQCVYGCPKCQEIDDFEILCDVTGCAEVAGCGWPSADGYRHTCHKHTTAVAPAEKPSDVKAP